MLTEAPMLESHGWRGDITVTVTSPGGVEVVSFRNLVSDAGLNLLRNLLDGTVSDGEIKYVAFGTGTTTPAAGQTQLVSEQFRKAVTRQTVAGTGLLDTSVYLAPAEANSFEINEVAWFAGATASATVNTGVMVARVLYVHQKTSLESLQVDRRDSIGRA